MRREHESGSPPPRTSSSDGIPVDVSCVNGDDGQGRVPGNDGARVAGALRLKADIEARLKVQQESAASTTQFLVISETLESDAEVGR